MSVEVRTDDAATRFSPGATFALGRPAPPAREASPRGAPADSREEPAELVEPGDGAGDQSGTVRLAGARCQRGRWFLRFEEVRDRDAAETLRDVLLLADLAAEPAEDDAWYVDDLAGCEVVDVVGRPLGAVTAVETGPAQDRLVVRPVDGGPPVLVPFVTALVPEVDVEGRRVVVDPPGGLFPEPEHPEPDGDGDGVSATVAGAP